MIYLLNESTGILVGLFDTIQLADAYLESSVPDRAQFTYAYLERVDSMNYVSRVTIVDGSYVYNNKAFWLGSSHAISDDYGSHVVLDAFLNPVTKERFDIERRNNCTRLQRIMDTPSEVTYNMEVGREFIALFREGCIHDDKGEYTGRQIAKQMATLVSMLNSGSFKEAKEEMADIERNSYFTDGVLMHYSTMLAAADAITYPSASLNS